MIMSILGNSRGCKKFPAPSRADSTEDKVLWAENFYGCFSVSGFCCLFSKINNTSNALHKVPCSLDACLCLWCASPSNFLVNRCRHLHCLVTRLSPKTKSHKSLLIFPEPPRWSSAACFYRHQKCLLWANLGPECFTPTAFSSVSGPIKRP